MDVRSSSLALSGSPGSNDSLHGLKFGQKIYFEDGCGSSSTASLAASGAASTPARKGKSQGAAQPPRCQVVGCMVDLCDAKAYYSRHKVCGMHSKSPKVIVAGLEQRFCQQCSRFHQLPEFDQGKRSCRRKLAGHNERRRKPPAASLLSRTGLLLSSFHGDNGRLSGSILDFGHPKFLGTSMKGVWPAISVGNGGNNGSACQQWQGGFSNSHVSVSPGSPGSVDVLFSSSAEVPPGSEYLAGVSESSCALSLLSSQQWGTTFPPRTQASCFNRPHMPQNVISNSYMTANSWSFKDHGGNVGGSSSNSHVRNEMEFNRSRFSGELELALQDNRHNVEFGPGRGYENSHDGIPWSL